MNFCLREQLLGYGLEYVIMQVEICLFEIDYIFVVALILTQFQVTFKEISYHELQHYFSVKELNSSTYILPNFFLLLVSVIFSAAMLQLRLEVFYPKKMT